MTSAGPWTSVSMPYVSGHRGDAWGAEAAEHGGTGTQKLLSVDEVVASATIADMLGLAAGEPVVVRRRLMLFNDRPVELVDSYYPRTSLGAPGWPSPVRSPAVPSPSWPTSVIRLAASAKTSARGWPHHTNGPRWSWTTRPVCCCSPARSSPRTICPSKPA